MFFVKYVEKYGFNDFEILFNVMYEIMKRNIVEYVIWFFFEIYYEDILNIL